MANLFVELNYPGDQRERWRIKIIRFFNVPSTEIRARKDQKTGKIRFLAIGRSVPYKEAKRYFENYLRQRGLLENVVWMRLKT